MENNKSDRTHTLLIYAYAYMRVFELNSIWKWELPDCDVYIHL